MAGEQAAEGVEFDDAPFGGGGQVGLDDREVGETGQGAPAASGTALLDLDRPDRSLGLVVQPSRGLHVMRRAGSIRIWCG